MMNVFAFVLLAFVVSTHGVKFSYKTGPYGPSNWKINYTDCGKQRQSPIDIQTSTAQYNVTFKPLNFSAAYSTAATSLNFTITNNGHTLVASTPGDIHTVKSNAVDGTYNLAQLHFHWGSADVQGSEHLVNGFAYPAEVHLVHYNAKYSTISTALGHEDGLLVVGVLLKVSSVENTVVKKLTDNIPANTKTQTKVTGLKLIDLLPLNNKFYHYKGSLTTPKCQEVVSWFVMKEPMSLSLTQLQKFRILKDDKNNPIVDNFRPVQALNGRKVYANFESGCGTLKASLYLFGASVLAMLVAV